MPPKAERAEPPDDDSRELLDLVLSATHDGLVDWDLASGVARYSPRWKMLLGFEEHELADAPDLWKTLTHPDDLPRIEALIRDHLEHVFPFSDRWRMQHRNGDWRWVMCRSVILRAADGSARRFLGVYTDVTDQVQAEERYRDSLERLGRAQRQLMEASHRAGMAEVASSVLHNVGNVLNSVNVSAGAAREVLARSHAPGLGKAVKLLREHQADLGPFFTGDARGKKLLDFLERLAEALPAEGRQIAAELESLQKNIDHIKVIVSMQQSHARSPGGMTERFAPAEVVEDALKLVGSWEAPAVELVREYAPIAEVDADRHKLLQILTNLLANARQALAEAPRRAVTVRLLPRPGDRFAVEVEDTGGGITAENLPRIFQHGFTTRKEGHGFGLHASALAARAMGGTLAAHSDGAGRGARFEVELPLRAPGR